MCEATISGKYIVLECGIKIPLYRTDSKCQLILARELKRLNPILTSEAVYYYNKTNPDGPAPELSTTTIVSDGRITPTCPYFTFSGPEIDTQQVTILSPGRSASFAKLPDYVYNVEWNIEGDITKLQLLHLDTNRLLALGLYTVKGNLAKIRKNSGRFQIYGQLFPFIVSSLDDLNITITISTAYRLGDRDPWRSGDHYIHFKHEGKSYQLLVYTVVYDPETGLSTRIVVPELAEFNRQLNERYQSIVYLPCLPPDDNRILQLPDPTNIAVDKDTVRSYIPDFLCGFGEDNNLWLEFDTRGRAFSPSIVLTNTYNWTTQTLGSYLYVFTTGTVNVNISNLFIDYAPAVDARSIFCGGFGNVRLSLIDYYTKRPLYVTNPVFNGSRVTYNDNYNIILTNGEYVYFSISNVDYKGLPEFFTPIISGNITLTYV